MKVNQEVFDLASDLSEVGLPVFAGIPVVSSLMQLSGPFYCNWYGLITSPGGFADCEVECDSETDPANAALRGPLRQNELLDIVEDLARPASWEVMVETLHSIRNRDLDRYHFRFGPVYKPVYFMFW